MIDRNLASALPDTPNPEPQTHDSLWYAFYTSPRAEKQVAKRLNEQGIVYYLPLIKTLKVWSDRKKMVEVPLINSYIFVKTQEHKLREIINIYGVSRFISFEGRPASIPDDQIENLRLLVHSDEKIEVTGEKLDAGDSVEVTHGTLRGIRGRLVKIQSRNRLVVQIDKLDVNFIVTIQKAFLKKLR